MSIEQHVTNLELSKKLKEIGIKQKSEFYWVQGVMDFYITQNQYENPLIASAFLASELLMMLPTSVVYDDEEHKLEISKLDKGFKSILRIKYGWDVNIEENTIPDSVAYTLIYLLESKCITIDEINARISNESS